MLEEELYRQIGKLKVENDWLKKNIKTPLTERRTMIELKEKRLFVTRQCELLSLVRSSYYYRSQGERAKNLELMRIIDEQYLRTPFYGLPRMTVVLKKMGYVVNHKRVKHLIRDMGITAVYPRRKTSQPQAMNKIYPYLLINLEINRPDQDGVRT